MTVPSPVMKSSRQLYLDWLLKKEGGVADRPPHEDPGGLTNKGITMPVLSEYLGRAATRQDMMNLTVEQAREIYSIQFWNKVQANLLPSGVDWCVTDFAVHSSPRRAVRYLQMALGFKEPGDTDSTNRVVDGFIGKVTLAAAAEADPHVLIRRYCDLRLEFMRRQPNHKHNPGWEPRLADLQARALRIAPVRPVQAAVNKERRERDNATVIVTTGTAILAGLPAAKEAFEAVNDVVAPYATVMPQIGLVVGAVVIVGVLYMRVKAASMERRAVESGAAVALVEDA